MSDSLPPDPYLALGVAKDATPAAIKAQYRKLVLKFHPDKVQDEDQKAVAAEQFHKIQSAYEIISDDDQRARYDAQCKLADLRRDMMGRHGSSRSNDDFPPRPSDIPRTYETREVRPEFTDSKPTYSNTDYFDLPHATSRKATDTDRSSRRPPPRDDRHRSKTSSSKDPKKSERTEREERDRRATKDMRREREQKTSMGGDYTASSDSEEFSRSTRRPREEEESRRPREAFKEQSRRSRDDVPHSQYEGDDKSHRQYDDAREYINRSRRRPSPVRQGSTKDRIFHVVSSDGRPTAVRRESVRTKMSESRRGSTREYEAEPFRWTEFADDPPPRRPPTFSQSRSSPADIRIPAEKPRAQSVQMDRDRNSPPVRRSETMPHADIRSRDSHRSKEPPLPQRSSALRQSETFEDFADSTFPPSGHRSRRSYDEYPSESYITEIREPMGVRPQSYNRSPSPMTRTRDGARDRARPERRSTTSSRYQTETVSPTRPPGSSRTTSTSYVYPPRPAASRENSGGLFGEIRPGVIPITVKSQSAKYAPNYEDVKVRREFRHEDISTSPAHASRRSGDGRVLYSSSRTGNQRAELYARG